jgi:hypothetical protein
MNKTYLPERISRWLSSSGPCETGLIHNPLLSARYMQKRQKRRIPSRIKMNFSIYPSSRTHNNLRRDTEGRREFFPCQQPARRDDVDCGIISPPSRRPRLPRSHRHGLSGYTEQMRLFENKQKACRTVNMYTRRGRRQVLSGYLCRILNVRGKVGSLHDLSTPLSALFRHNKIASNS